MARGLVTSGVARKEEEEKKKPKSTTAVQPYSPQDVEGYGRVMLTSGQEDYRAPVRRVVETVKKVHSVPGPPPWSGPKPGSVDEKLQKAVQSSIIKEEKLFRRVSEPLIQKSMELRGKSVEQFEKGKPWVGFGSYMAGTALRFGKGFYEGVTFPFRPGLWQETTGSLQKLATDKKTRAKAVTTFAQDPFGYVAEVGGGVAGGYTIGKGLGKVGTKIKQYRTKKFLEKYPEELFYPYKTEHFEYPQAMDVQRQKWTLEPSKAEVIDDMASEWFKSKLVTKGDSIIQQVIPGSKSIRETVYRTRKWLDTGVNHLPTISRSLLSKPQFSSSSVLSNLMAGVSGSSSAVRSTWQDLNRSPTIDKPIRRTLPFDVHGVGRKPSVKDLMKTSIVDKVHDLPFEVLGVDWRKKTRTKTRVKTYTVLKREVFDLGGVDWRHRTTEILEPAPVTKTRRIIIPIGSLKRVSIEKELQKTRERQAPVFSIPNIPRSDLTKRKKRVKMQYLKRLSPSKLRLSERMWGEERKYGVPLIRELEQDKRGILSSLKKKKKKKR